MTSLPILRARVLKEFSCLGDRCADTCCRGWSMQMDEATLARYREQAPELLDAVEPGGADAPWIMRKDEKTGVCVKLEGGWCGIHKSHGEKFLGDACYFYPRVTRSLGGKTLMTASGSCPEIVRLMLGDEAAFECEAADAERLPQSLKNYLPGMPEDDALAVHRAFLLAARNDALPVEDIFSRIAGASRSLERIEAKNWPRAASFYLSQDMSFLPPPEGNPADAYNLLHALAGLISATRKPMPERLQKTVAEMESALGARLEWREDRVLIHVGDESLPSLEKLRASWKRDEKKLQPVLKRWLAMQLSVGLFPFAGLGETLSERATLIGVRLATVKLALASARLLCADPPQDETVRVIQSLSRFLDHLGNPRFSMDIYAETGWVREARLRGLLYIL